MEKKFLCLMATFDEETSKKMKEIEEIIQKTGVVGKQTPNIPHHITLAYFETSQEEVIKELLEDVCSRTNPFDLDFNHIGLFGLKVLFLAPDVNDQLLALHDLFAEHRIKHTRGWTAHATILIDEPENIQKALPLVANNFTHLRSRVESLVLYEFFPTRFIAKYKLQ